MKPIIIVSIIIAIFCLLLGAGFILLLNIDSETQSPYTPTFITQNGNKVLMEVIDNESGVFLYLDSNNSNIDSIDKFNEEFEIFQFDNLNENVNFSVKKVNSVLESNGNYTKFGFPARVNVYCIGIFSKSEPVEFSVGSINGRLPSPSEAWMCEGIDLKNYPK
jgi:hypothetical protein